MPQTQKCAKNDKHMQTAIEIMFMRRVDLGVNRWGISAEMKTTEKRQMENLGLKSLKSEVNNNIKKK